jgi:hypothetical protein
MRQLLGDYAPYSTFSGRFPSTSADEWQYVGGDNHPRPDIPCLTPSKYVGGDQRSGPLNEVGGFPVMGD